MNFNYLSAILVCCVGICSPFLLDINQKSGVSVETSEPNITFGNPACKNCTNYVAGQLGVFKPFLKTYNYQTFANGRLPTCAKCSFVGLQTISMYGDDCATPSTTNPNITDYQTNYQWDNITLVCEDCELSTNPMQLATSLIKDLLEALKICNNDDTSIDLSPAIQGITDVLTIPNINNLLSPQCLMSSAITPSVGTANFTITLQFLHMKAMINVQKDMGLKGLNRITVLNGSVVDRNYTNTIGSCKPTKPGILNSCDCVFQSKPFLTTVVQVLDLLLQCGIRSNNNEFKSALDSYVICSGIIG